MTMSTSSMRRSACVPPGIRIASSFSNRERWHVRGQAVRGKNLDELPLHQKLVAVCELDTGWDLQLSAERLELLREHLGHTGTAARVAEDVDVGGRPYALACLVRKKLDHQPADQAPSLLA
jgi:hypothetical protein